MGGYVAAGDTFDAGRDAALAGREVWCNPHTGGEAELWFKGWQDVPEAQRGSQPAPAPKRITRKKRRGGFSKLHLKGATPRPWSGL